MALNIVVRILVKTYFSGFKFFFMGEVCVCVGGRGGGGKKGLIDKISDFLI